MKYELMLLLRPFTNEDVNEKVFPKIQKSVESLKGKITAQEPKMGRKMLAYEIESFKEGFYLLCDLEIEREDLSKLEKAFKMNNDILRYLLVDEDNL